MKALLDHWYALKLSFSLLIQGKFLFFFIPGVIIAILFMIYAQTLQTANTTLGFVSYVPWIGGYLHGAVDTVFGWIEGVSIFIYQFMIITVLSPVHTILSERVDEHQTGKKYKSNWEKFFNDILRTIGVVVLGGLMYMFLKFIWWIFAYNLELTFLTPYVSMILLGFFTGFNSFDYSLERYGVSVAKSWKYAFQHPLHMIFTGLIFSLLLMIPYIGVVIAPVLLTMTGTICFLRIRNRKSDYSEYKNTTGTNEREA